MGLLRLHAFEFRLAPMLAAPKHPIGCGIISRSIERAICMLPMRFRDTFGFSSTRRT
jgi:hypothetical protein